jgi:hypothetical protein
MEKINETIGELNGVLNRAGFPSANFHTLHKNNLGWSTVVGIELQFDDAGSLLKSEFVGEAVKNG